MIITPRYELGYERTVCACDLCTINCEFIPGMLIPADLPRLRRLVERGSVRGALYPDLSWLNWVADHLAASPGALVARQGEAFRIPTIVPQLGPGGCVFLDDEWRCRIHEDAPYGCAFMDIHMEVEEGRQRSADGLLTIYQDWAESGPYSRLWHFLHAILRRARPATESRALMDEAIRKRGLL